MRFIVSFTRCTLIVSYLSIGNILSHSLISITVLFYSFPSSCRLFSTWINNILPILSLFSLFCLVLRMFLSLHKMAPIPLQSFSFLIILSSFFRHSSQFFLVIHLQFIIITFVRPHFDLSIEWIHRRGINPFVPFQWIPTLFCRIKRTSGLIRNFWTTFSEFCDAFVSILSDVRNRFQNGISP